MSTFAQPAARPAVRRAASRHGPVQLERRPDGYYSLPTPPDAEALREFYRGFYYDRQGGAPIERQRRELAYHRAIWELRHRALERALGSAGGRRLLDVGAGPGFLLDYLRERGWQVSGVEPSRTAARHARDVLGLDVAEGRFEDLPLAEPFDAVHCALVLEHVPDPEAFTARLAAATRPGGVAFVEVPNDFSPLQEAARDHLGAHDWWVLPRHHLNYFDFDSLARLLRRQGLEEVERLTSFPMELFLLTGSDYLSDRSLGKRCHELRVRFELGLLAGARVEVLERLYRSLAAQGVGRTCQLVCRRTG